MTSQLEKEVAHYQEWRDEMISGIESYKSWLDTNGYADIQQSLRIYDLIESLRNDRMTLAFLAEFSRGKTELINAMFFSDFKQRLLPSNVGRTTMCPTEIYYDATEEPYMRLLPIETRSRQETVTSLKRQHVEWIKVKLNVESREEMAEAMKHLVEVKMVSIAVLNKIELMWDELKSEADIAVDVERQLAHTSGLLALPRTHVMAISAQKALLARVRGDDTLLAKSGIEQLEYLLASEIIPAKQEIMRAAVQREIGSMVDASRLAVANQLNATKTELKELAEMSGKSRGMAQTMVARLEVDRKNYHATVQTVRATVNTVTNQGATLVKQLDDERLDD